MKKLAVLLLLLLLLVAAVGQAQEPTRVLVLPFDASRSFEPYGLGVATGVQRILNSLDGVYAPPVAESGLFVRRAFEADLEAIAEAAAAFEAEVVVSGAVAGEGDVLELVLAFSGPDGEEIERLRLQVANEPAAAVREATRAIAERLGRDSQQDRRRIDELATEAPRLASLASVARASSRLTASLSELGAAAELDGDSSWVRAEYARALALAGRDQEALESARRAVQEQESDVEALVVLGIVARATGDRDLARDSFERALALNSRHALALAGLAGLSSDTSEEARLLEQALVSYPRQIEAVLRLAEMEPSHQRALQRLRRASEHLPESVALHREFVRRAVAAGDPAGAVRYLEQVASAPLSTSPALYAQAAELPDSHLEEALQLLRQGREVFPESSGLQLTEADLLRRAGRSDEAVTILEDLHGRYPESVEVANSLAVTLAGLGEIDRAREVFSSVAEDSPTVRLNLGRLLLEAGQSRAAIATLEPLAEEANADAETLALYGVALGRTGRVDEAITVLERALELQPDEPTASRAKALLEQQSRITGDDAISFEGEAAVAFEQGLHALETGDATEAAIAFERARQLTDHPLAAFYHGYALHRDGRPREALTAYREAVESYPESDTVLNNLGYAHLQLGRLDLALDTLRRAAEANPENAQVHVNLGLTFFGLGRHGEAIEAFDRAIALDPALTDDLADIRRRAEEGRGQ